MQDEGHWEVALLYYRTELDYALISLCASVSFVIFWPSETFECSVVYMSSWLAEI